MLEEIENVKLEIKFEYFEELFKSLNAVMLLMEKNRFFSEVIKDISQDVKISCTSNIQKREKIPSLGYVAYKLPAYALSRKEKPRISNILITDSGKMMAVVFKNFELLSDLLEYMKSIGIEINANMIFSNEDDQRYFLNQKEIVFFGKCLTSIEKIKPTLEKLAANHPECSKEKEEALSFLSSKYAKTEGASKIEEKEDLKAIFFKETTHYKNSLPCPQRDVYTLFLEGVTKIKNIKMIRTKSIGPFDDWDSCYGE